MALKINTIILKDEPITRYIFQKKHFSIENRRVKVGAFYPPPKNYPNEISVFRILGLLESEVWKLGDCEVASKRDKDIKARADVIVVDIIESNLSIEPDTKDQHDRHANIILPDDDIASKESAAELSLRAKLVIR